MGTKAKTMATLQVRFTTQLPPPWVAPKTPMEIPAGIKAEGLNKVLTQLLKTDEATSFRFVLSEELLGEDETLGQFIQAHDGSMETVLDVEYVEAMPEPEEGVTREHDDWVGAISTWADGLVLTGSYDGVARLWQDDQLAGSMPGHEAAIKSVTCFMTSQGRGAVTASKDHTMRVWRLSDQLDVVAAAIGTGHTGSIEAVAASADGRILCSGSWDRTIKLWNGECATEPIKPKPSKKKRKGDNVEEWTETECLETLTGHADAVTALEWIERDGFVSGSWDHTLRAWDSGTATCVRVVNFNKAVRAISWSASGQLLASAQGDKNIALWDIKGEGHLKLRLGSSEAHKEAVVDVAWMPNSSSLLASASHDKTTMLWDIRSPKLPVATLTTHDDKVLCVHWADAQHVLSGGADCKVRSAQVGN